jgi:hypothetical protein
MQRMRILCAVALALTALLASACKVSGTTELTLVAENLDLGTQIADVRATATYAADRLNMTLEYLQTASKDVVERQQLLSGTLVQSGLNPSGVQPITVTAAPLGQLTPEAGGPQPQATPPPDAPNNTADTTSGGQPTLSNIVMAEAVGKDDCAVGSVTTFTPNADRIYVVATASNIPSGTKLNSRWLAGGKEVVAHDFTPDFEIKNACIWFFIDKTDTAFTPGNWSVQLEINGAAAGAPVAFSIQDAG